MLTSSWGPLGSLSAPFWETFGLIFVNILWTSLGSRFDINFWCFFDALQTLIFELSPRRGLTFCIFLKSFLTSIFGPKNISKSNPKRSQDGSKRVPKRCQKVFEILMLFGRVKKSKKVILESLGSRFGRNMAPKSGPKNPPGPQKVTKNGPKSFHHRPLTSYVSRWLKRWTMVLFIRSLWHLPADLLSPRGRRQWA